MNTNSNSDLPTPRNKCIYLFGITSEGYYQWIRRELATEFDTWIVDYGERQFGYQKLRSRISLSEFHNMCYSEITENEFYDVFLDVWDYINNKAKQISLAEVPKTVTIEDTTKMIRNKDEV